MSKITSKTITISLLIGFLLTCGSLFFSKPDNDSECVSTTSDPRVGAEAFVQYNRGLPIAFVDARRQGCGRGIGEITRVRTAELLIDLVAWSVVGGLFWVGKNRIQRKKMS